MVCAYDYPMMSITYEILYIYIDYPVSKNLTLRSATKFKILKWASAKRKTKAKLTFKPISNLEFFQNVHFPDSHERKWCDSAKFKNECSCVWTPLFLLHAFSASCLSDTHFEDNGVCVFVFMRGTLEYDV